MATPEKDPISLTPKQIGVILAVILTVASGLPIGVNKFTPSARDDPFTGDDGERLRTEIRRECQASLGFIQAQIDDIEAADAILEEKYHDHRHEAPPRWVKEKLISLERELLELSRQ